MILNLVGCVLMVMCLVVLASDSEPSHLTLNPPKTSLTVCSVTLSAVYVVTPIGVVK